MLLSTDGEQGAALFSTAGFFSIRTGRQSIEGKKKRGEILVHSVLGDNECFVRENPSTVTVGGENVRQSYGLLAFNPRGPAQQSN